MLMGADDLVHHAEQRLGVKVGNTTGDGNFTLEGVECIAACTEAPCLQVNYRYFDKVSGEDFDKLVDDLVAGRLDDEVPPHGTLARVRQHIPDDRRAGSVVPEGQTEPAWMHANEAPKSAVSGEGAS
jgi:NADH-quinone oxidoreductase subunit E